MINSGIAPPMSQVVNQLQKLQGDLTAWLKANQTLLRAVEGMPEEAEQIEVLRINMRHAVSGWNQGKMRTDQRIAFLQDLISQEP